MLRFVCVFFAVLPFATVGWLFLFYWALRRRMRRGFRR